MSGIIIDFHSHVLPGVDDGSKSVKESLAMLKEEARQGIRKVVATPHFYARYDSPQAFLERRDSAYHRLWQAMKEQPDMPELILGAEVYFFWGMSESEHLEQLTIGQKSCILIEMPQPPWSKEMYRELRAIYEKRGLLPIVAHVDRYIAPLRTYGIPGELMKLPVMVQANGEFFLERSTAAMALRMLKKGQIHLLGSDCHSMGRRRPRLGEALEQIEKKLGPGVLKEIARNQDEALEVFI